MNQNENKKLIDKKLRSQLKCIAEDFFTDNLVSGYPVPDQDVKGRWHLSNGPGDFSIVKPDTIKLASKESAPTIQQVTEERDKAVEMLSESLTQLKYLDKRFPTGTTPNVVSRIETFLNSLTIGREAGEK